MDAEVDEAGMPVHLPMGFTAAGEGPEEDAASVWVGCWCVDRQTCEVYPWRPGPVQIYPVYFQTCRQLGMDPHDIARKIIAGKG